MANTIAKAKCNCRPQRRQLWRYIEIISEALRVDTSKRECYSELQKGSDSETMPYKIDTSELLPEDIGHEVSKNIAAIIGVGNLLNLADEIGGTTTYFPKSETLLREARNNAIIREFNGHNHMELAFKYEVTERWIREIVNKHNQNTGATQRKKA